jgi:hypothetical protein
MKDKVCSPLKTVEYMTCPPFYIEGSCVFNADKKKANWFCTAGYEKSVHYSGHWRMRCRLSA